MVKCFCCQKEILDNTLTYRAYDVPYVNLPVHKECGKTIEKQPGGMDQFVQDNQARFLAFVAQNAVVFGSRQDAPTGKPAKSKTLVKPTKKTKATKPTKKTSAVRHKR